MTTRAHLAPADAVEARIGARVAEALALHASAVPADIAERLRFGREQALARARQAQTLARPARQVVAFPGQGAAALAGPSSWWLKLASGLPLLVLLVGLAAIDHLMLQEQVIAAAEIDTMLLADDLPPEAYADPGFGEYLRSAPAQP